MLAVSERERPRRVGRQCGAHPAAPCHASESRVLRLACGLASAPGFPPAAGPWQGGGPAWRAGASPGNTAGNSAGRLGAAAAQPPAGGAGPGRRPTREIKSSSWAGMDSGGHIAPVKPQLSWVLPGRYGRPLPGHTIVFRHPATVRNPLFPLAKSFVATKGDRVTQPYSISRLSPPSQGQYHCWAL